MQGIVFGVWLMFIVVYLLLWARALQQIVRTPDEQYRSGNQILWAAVVVFLPFAGLIAYRVLGAPKRHQD